MEQLRLAGVRDDGEHLIVKYPDSARYRLKIDQRLRQAIQYARASRQPGARRRVLRSARTSRRGSGRAPAWTTWWPSPGWEPERVRRYEWPVLAERSTWSPSLPVGKVSGTNPSARRLPLPCSRESPGPCRRRSRPKRPTRRGPFQLTGTRRLREDQLWTVQLASTPAERDSLPRPSRHGGATTPPRAACARTTTGPGPWERTARRARFARHRPHPCRPPAPPSAGCGARAGPADNLLDVLQARRGRRRAPTSPATTAARRCSAAGWAR
ncbi:DUF3071 domain-containing protein [Kocuria rhizophila]|nr:DUF3071 domain-containing protein [Kocuria rhizophila]